MRPTLRARYWIWKDRAQRETPGIGLFQNKDIKGHLTCAEARLLADQLHDMADRIESQAS